MNPFVKLLSNNDEEGKARAAHKIPEKSDVEAQISDIQNTNMSDDINDNNGLGCGDHEHLQPSLTSTPLYQDQKEHTESKSGFQDISTTEIRKCDPISVKQNILNTENETVVMKHSLQECLICLEQFGE